MAHRSIKRSGNARHYQVKANTAEAADAVSRRRFPRLILLAVLIAGVAATVIIGVQQNRSITGLPPEPSAEPEATTDPPLAEVGFTGDRSTWQLLALSDDELEKVSLVELNLAVVREIPGHEDLDAAKYEQVIDQWTREFAEELPAIDASFRGREAEYHHDLRFYRIGQLMAWLGHKKNIRYIPEQRDLDAVTYTDAAELFLHGLIDTRLGTCGNMPALQAAIARRLGWPVSLAPVESHTLCRFDDGEVVYNIETTHTDQGGFSAGSNQDYIAQFNLPPCAMTEGDTLETMSAREMLGYFIGLRARYYQDTGDWQKADQDFALARSLLPRHRKLLLASLELTLRRGEAIFDRREPGHPLLLCAAIGQQFVNQRRSEQQRRRQAHQNVLAEVERATRINAENRRRVQRTLDQHREPTQPIHHDPWGLPNHPHDPHHHQR
ncbi:MAG: hypothetical protein AAGI37_15380 [Planctomycetota bacterium]